MKMNRRFFIAGIILAASVSAWAEIKPAKYVILMIGDGLGPTQRQVAERYRRARSGQPKEELWMNTLPVKGITSTHAANKPVTDSAAAATALACGHKTNYGVVGMDASCATALETVAELAKKQGKKVGIISSVPIDHATPASFYAHQPKRSRYYEIALSLPDSEFDYFAGQPFYGTDKAKGRTLPADAAEAAGYRVVRTADEFNSLTPADEKVLVLTDVAYSIDEKDEQLNLTGLTRKGLQLLENPNGFFLMVEGGKIDWSGHANDLATNIKETLAFDDAVAEVLKFYSAHNDETLVVVTGDHETGGLKTNFTGTFNPERFCYFVEQQTISGAEFETKVTKWKQTGISFDDALQEIEVAFGLTDLSEEEQQTIKKAYEAVMTGKIGKKISPALARMYGKKNPVVLACQNVIAKRCGIVWTSFGHTSVTVPTTATGVNAELFGGKTDNTEIGQRLQAIILAERK